MEAIHSQGKRLLSHMLMDPQHGQLKASVQDVQIRGIPLPGRKGCLQPTGAAFLRDPFQLADHLQERAMEQAQGPDGLVLGQAAWLVNAR